MKANMLTALALVMGVSGLAQANSTPIQEGQVAIENVTAYQLSRVLEVAAGQDLDGCKITSSFNGGSESESTTVNVKKVSRDIQASFSTTGKVVYTYPYTANPNDPAFSHRWAYKLSFTDTGVEAAGEKITILYDQDGKTIIQVKVTKNDLTTANNAEVENITCTSRTYANHLKK